VNYRIEKEKEFHNKRFDKEIREHLDKYYSVTRNSIYLYKQRIFCDCADKRVLEYGCGLGNFAIELSENGAEVYGIDISDIAIEKAAETAIKSKLENRTHFYVMNAEELNFKDNFFDKVCGTAILHHLDLSKALSELCRVLKKDGKAVFLEPLGHNLFINLYRKFTPSLRTEDEHPLVKEDMKLFSNFFDKVEIHYFHMCSLIAIPFRNLFFFRGMLKSLELMDKFLFKFNFFRLNAWQAVIELSKPKKTI
jgi:ubiquinone/menaquinone biosynthesis C-methylase UbiE